MRPWIFNVNNQNHYNDTFYIGKLISISRESIFISMKRLGKLLKYSNYSVLARNFHSYDFFEKNSYEGIQTHERKTRTFQINYTIGDVMKFFNNWLLLFFYSLFRDMALPMWKIGMCTRYHFGMKAAGKLQFREKICISSCDLMETQVNSSTRL